MKKLLAGLMAMALVLSTGAVTTSAACGGRGGRGGRGCGYVDANGNGVCDNYAAAGKFVDANGDGICDNCAAACKFVDADGDGICDNCGRTAHGYGCGAGYVDADGDGVCDNYAQGKPGCGGRRGQGFGKGRYGR